MSDIRYIPGVHKAVWMDQFSHPPLPTRKVEYTDSKGKQYFKTEYDNRNINQIANIESRGRLFFKTVEEAKAAVEWGSAAFKIEDDGELTCVRSNYDSSG